MRSSRRRVSDPPSILVRRVGLPAALLAAALIAVPPALAAPSCPAGGRTLSLVPGTTWTYEGDVQSTVWKKESGHAIRRHVVRTMEVRAAFRRGDTTVALLKGHPRELAWYEPGTPRRAYLWFQRDDGTLSLVSDDVERRLQRWKDTGEIPRATEDVESPLRVGRTRGGDDEIVRPDNRYQWHVELARCVRLRALGRQLHPEYRVAYRTCPDDVIVYFTPGIGITRFAYHHHGTIAETDVRLVAFHPGPTSARIEQIPVAAPHASGKSAAPASPAAARPPHQPSNATRSPRPETKSRGAKIVAGDGTAPSTRAARAGWRGRAAR